MNRRRQGTIRTLMMLLIVSVGAVVAADYAIDWYTVDGGGDMSSTGGDYELSGTIGQPDARTELMTGGDYTLTGGFWVTPARVTTAWRSVRTHGAGLGELAIELDPSATGISVVSETRRDGVQKIEVDFDEDLTTLVTGTVHAEDLTNGGTIAATSQTLINGGLTLAIEFDPGLPDQACYRIDLGANIPGLIGDTVCMVKALAGNTNGDNSTDLIDMAQVKSKNGSPVVGADVKFDVNLDGNIDLIDMALVKSLNGGSVACP